MFTPKLTTSLSTKSANSLIYFLRREPYYHKLQYSKVPKFDVAAAIFGAAVSAFVGYLTLSTLGSAGADLTDLLTLTWHLFIASRVFKLQLYLMRSVLTRLTFFSLLVTVVATVISYYMFFVRRLPTFNPLKRRVRKPEYTLAGRGVSTVSALAGWREIPQHLTSFSCTFELTQGCFFHPKVTKTTYHYIRKLCYISKTSSVLWLNFPFDHILTRKALNVRMGKGRGSRKGACARLWPGTIFCAIKGSRLGLWKKTKRFLAVRSSALIAMQVNPNALSSSRHPGRAGVKAGQSFLTSLATTLLDPARPPQISRQRRVVFSLLTSIRLIQRTKKLKVIKTIQKITRRSYWSPTRRRRQRRLRRPFRRLLFFRIFRLRRRLQVRLFRWSRRRVPAYLLQELF